MGFSRQSYDALSLGNTSIADSGGLTIVHPFYGEVDRFNFLYDNHWSQFNDPKIKILAIDDCGTPEIHPEMEGRNCDFDLSIYRIYENIRHNAVGAFNLGMLLADTEYVLMLDSDCSFSVEDMQRIMEFKPSDNVLYKFSKIRIENTGPRYIRHNQQAASLISKRLFTRLSMYDEDMTGETGGYGYWEYLFANNVESGIYGHHTGQQFRRIFIDLAVREYMGSIYDYTHDPGRTNKKLWYDKAAGRVPINYQKLNFPWQCTYHNQPGEHRYIHVRDRV